MNVTTVCSSWLIMLGVSRYTSIDNTWHSGNNLWVKVQVDDCTSGVCVCLCLYVYVSVYIYVYSVITFITQIVDYGMGMEDV